jgi:hypothetical protein
MLKDHADFLAGCPQIPFAQGCHLNTVDQHLPRLGPFQHIDAAHQSAFACAAEADDAEDLPRLDLEADIIQGPEFPLAIAVYLGQVVNLNQTSPPPISQTASKKSSSKTEEDYTNHFNSVSHLSSVLTRHQQELAPCAAAPVAGFHWASPSTSLDKSKNRLSAI